MVGDGRGRAWLAVVAQDAPAVGDWAEGVDVLGTAGQVGPWLLGVATLLVLARAYSRRTRYRALCVFDEAAQERVHAAIRELEAGTSGEVVPVVVERSDGHPAARWAAGLVFLLIGSVLLMGVLPWDNPPLLLACQLLLGALGAGLASVLPDVARLFVSEARAAHVSEEQAVQEFHGLDLKDTAGRTGVLLFVSLFEHRVVVLADEGIAAAVPDGTWAEVDKAILAGIRAGSLERGLLDGLAACGAVLAEHAPVGAGKRNEIPDRLIVRRD